MLLATEYAPPGKRGLYSAFPQLGPSVGFVLGNALFLLLDATMSDETFRTVGWRIPFLASAVLLVVGYYIRVRIAETPVFQAAIERKERSRVPFADLLRSQPMVLLLGAFLPELFRVRFRYSGASFAYSASGIVGGGISPIVATDLLARTGSSAAVSAYVVGIALVCLVSVALLRETKDADFTDGLQSSRTA